jgi:phytol kinase
MGQKERGRVKITHGLLVDAMGIHGLSMSGTDFPLWMQLGVTGAWLGTLGLVAEWFHQSKLVGSEVVRKLVHVGVGNIILAAWWMRFPLWLGVGASVFFSAIAFLSYRFPILSSINGIGRKSLGTFFYALSIGILIGLFWAIDQPQFAAIGVLVMTWGDGLAALIGQRFGQHPYQLWGMHKSWEGSLGMAAISFTCTGLILLGTYGYCWPILLVALAVALVATGLEAFSKYGIDNLTVPLGSALVAYGLTQALLPFS